MSVTVDDLLDQLSEDDDRKPQLQIYFDTAKAYVKNAVSSDTVDAPFFSVENVSWIYSVICVFLLVIPIVATMVFL